MRPVVDRKIRLCFQKISPIWLLLDMISRDVNFNKELAVIMLLFILRYAMSPILDRSPRQRIEQSKSEKHSSSDEILVLALHCLRYCSFTQTLFTS